MKIAMYKHQMTRWTSPEGVEQLEQAGWSKKEPTAQVKAVDEVIRLKPPVKTKATVKTLEEANDNKGDE